MTSESLLNEPPEEIIPSPPEKSWIGSICGYFRDFLDTDFKKTRAPKRQIASRDRDGILAGVALAKYPELYKDVWKLIATPFGADMTQELSVRRGKYRSRLSENLLAVINKQINTINDEKIDVIVDAVRSTARQNRENFADDPERYADATLAQLKSELLLTVVNPLLISLDTFFKNQGNESLETIYNLEEELGDLLVEPLKEPIAVAVAAAIVDNDFDELDVLIEESCQLGLIRSKFVDYFEAFSTSDFYRDLSELRATLKLKDNFQIYIYAGTLRFGKTSYPLFYFPVDVAQSESIYTVKIDPHLLVNKKAIDFGVGEVSRAIKHPIGFSIADRIIYVGQGESLLTHIQALLDDLTTALAMDGAIDLHEQRPQKISRSQVTIDNSLHFAAFDQSDESLLNDYEELLEKLRHPGELSNDFKELVTAFMSEEAVSLEAEVDEEWLKTALPERLVYDSPVPLNEEQRKVLSALNSPKGKYVAVEGPPGTGKSHTITAVVFDAILKNKNVLILSDKKEALDVAEQKIRQTMRAVRLDENFQDPILRLGKQGSTYTKILATKTVDQMRQRLQVAKANEGALEKEISVKERSLKNAIEEIEKSSAKIDLKKIIAFQKAENRLTFLKEEADIVFRREAFRKGVRAAKTLSDFLITPISQALLASTGCVMERNSLERFFDLARRMLSAKKTIEITDEMSAFGEFKQNKLSALGEIIDGLEAARKPIIGFLFSKGEVRRLARRLTDEFNYRNARTAHLEINKLRRAEQGFRDTIEALKLCNITFDSEVDGAFFQLLQNIVLEERDLYRISQAYADLLDVLDQDDVELLADIGITLENLSVLSAGTAPEVKSRLSSLNEHLSNFEEIKSSFTIIPELDYAGELRQLQHLHTQRLADTLDSRVVDFANRKKNKAAQIKTIIQKKQKFPKELFEDLREAFPVMIAGIRDYAEYVPLEKALFDLVIIDEASQVSIAQALPAFVRAKKVLVLGDRNQFSNVKTENASKMVNQIYKARIVEQFKSEENPDIALLNQIKMFDIKTSVLEFVERIANLKLMLRKHFRGYPELIGFSSKYFYGGALQAVKIRGRPIDEVIEFREIEHDDLHELQGNTNPLEAEAIIEEIERLAAVDSPPDVCVITPFNEQQRFIFHQLQKHPNGREMTEKLRLRIFTFDSCQGEEADVILYSMVATPLRDRLNYIFAKNIDQADDVEENLRLQRLNVGFSRAKEKIVIFYSKPISDFQGGIQVALSHYAGVLKRGREGPEASDVDPNSPMELQVLNWLRDVPLLDELDDRVEIDAQFELGAYLRQLNPSYSHPNYKVDFLIKVRGERETAQIIIEYDGFKEHFENLDEVDASNYEHYMKPEDVERQKILEGYGYKFLRINRFTIGEDPVKTLDERLKRLLDKFDIERQAPTLIEEHQKLQQSLRQGESKACSRCGDIKSLDDFFDQSLKKGKGGHGRVCQACKEKTKPTQTKTNKLSPTTSTDLVSRGSRTGKGSAGRVYLNCPYSQKAECKKLGGRWDPFKKKWYVPQGVDTKPFECWM